MRLAGALTDVLLNSCQVLHCNLQNRCICIRFWTIKLSKLGTQIEVFAIQCTSNVQAARPVFSKLVNNVVRLLFLDLLKAKLWPSQWGKHSSGTSFKNSRKVRH